MDKAGKEVLGYASKVVLTKDTTTIVGDGSTQEAVNKRVAQIRNLIEVVPSLPPPPLSLSTKMFAHANVACAGFHEDISHKA